MTAKDAIKNTIDFCHRITLSYVMDLADADLLARSVPDANHIAWQLGHLIVSEHHMIGQLGHRMPELPAGFAEAHAAVAAKSDNPARFAKKAEYLSLMEKVRRATLAALDATPEADLDKPGPEPVRSYAPTIGACFTMVGTHELMHAGQYVPVRRKLGKPVLF
jgi:hypothetical protein